MSDLAPGAQTWLDTLAEVFALETGEGTTVRSYKQSELQELPGAVTPAQVPCVVHYVRDCHPLYGVAAATILYWQGRSDFHLAPDVKPANLARLLRYYPRILAAAMGHVTLGGAVSRFTIPDQEGALRTITFKGADGSDSHMGIEVNWIVEQTVTGSYSIAA